MQIEYAFQLYEILVEKWLEREEYWINKDSLRAFSERLAVEIYTESQERGAERIPYKELVPLAKEWNISLNDWQIRGRSLLNRDAEGNYKFAHRSIMEYLVVQRLISGDKTFHNLELTDQMALFLQEMVCHNGSIVHQFDLNAHIQHILKEVSQINISKINSRKKNDVGFYLREANLASANLREANFASANLREANLRDADLRGADFRNADLRDTDLSGADLTAANLMSANLTAANLGYANLTAVNLGHANLTAVNLGHASLREANLREANLTRAYIIRAYIFRADLTEADLTEADLTEADLTEVSLSSAQLSSVKTLYLAQLESRLLTEIQLKYPHLLKKPESDE